MTRLLACIALPLLLLSAAPALAQSQAPVLSPSPEDLDRVGHALVDLVGTADARILLYAEVRGSDLLYETRYLADGETTPRRALPSNDALLNAVADAWRNAHARMGDNVWRVLVYRLDHGRLNARVLYAGDYDPNISFDDRNAAELAWLTQGR